MANLKEIRNRITSVHSTSQITSAMKMVSAAKLRRATEAITKMRPYAEKLQELLGNLSGSLESGAGSAFSEEREIKKVLIVVITSNRGLCGAFNTNVIKKTHALMQGKYMEQAAAGQVDVLTIGRKATEYFTKSTVKVVSSHDHIYDALNYIHTSVIADSIMEKFADAEYDHIDLIYNQFKNAASQLIIAEQYLPSVPKQIDGVKAKNSVHDYIFEPEKEGIVAELIPKSLKTQLYKALLDSNASEHGARMTAMHKATDNAHEMLKELKLTYNKARQASITTEILEIVSGAEALNA